MRMKQIMLLLSAVMVLGMLSGCDNNQSETTVPVQNTEPNQIQAPTRVTEPSPTKALTDATEPNPTQAPTGAIEPEPQLDEALQEICDLGIADRNLLLRAEDVCTRAEAAGMLSKVHEMQYNKKSRYLNDMVEAFEREEWSVPVTRFYFAQAIYSSAMENVFDFEYDNWYIWACKCMETNPGNEGPDASVVGILLDGSAGEGSVWALCPDLEEIDNPPVDNPNARHMLEWGSTPAVDYALKIYDRRDGRKVMELDESNCFRPHETMTVRQAAEAALRYYYYFEEEAEMVSYADTYTFDSSIITSELLTKETNLPDASCEKLPSEWRGNLLFKGRAITQALDQMPDKHYYEYEIQAIKEAGCNFIGLTFDFSRLQGPELQTGMLNETRLKELDQVIAWCMERDIHVDLRCCGAGGLSYDAGEYWYQWNHDALYTAEYVAEFAALWKALAQRYAEIPNCYLSFNLMIEPEINSESQYEAFFGPAVNAIREADPDRCIIADIHSGGLTGESMAKMGVALSYHAYDPREFCVLTTENQNDAEYLSTVKWPFTASNGKIYDAEAVLDSQIPDSVSANELAATAEEYGVGFMIGEWCFFGNGMNRYRYSDETIQSYLTDMADVMAEKGYGWCYGNSIIWYAPAIENGDYVRVQNTSLYIEQKMLGWFQEITGVK